MSPVLTILLVLAAPLPLGGANVHAAPQPPAQQDDPPPLTEEQQDRVMAELSRLRGHVPLPPPVEPDPKSPTAAGRYFVLLPKTSTELSNRSGSLTVHRGATAWEPLRPDESLEQLTAELNAIDPWLSALREAASLKTGDLRLGSPDTPCRNAGIRLGDPRRGIFGKTRAALRLLRAHAIIRWSAGHPDEAVEDLHASLGIACHIGDEPPLIGKLIALYALTDVVDTATELGILDQLRAVELRDGRLAAQADDPFHVRDFFRSLIRCRIAFAEEQLRGEQVGDQLRLELAADRLETDQIHDIFGRLLAPVTGQNPGVPPTVQSLVEAAEVATDRARALSVADARAALDQCRRQLPELESAWNAPDAFDRLRALEAANDQDPTGIAPWCVGPVGAAQRRWQEGKEKLARFLNTQPPKAP